MEVGKKVWQRWVFESLQELNYYVRTFQRKWFWEGEANPMIKTLWCMVLWCLRVCLRIRDRSNESLSVISGHRSLRIAVNHFLWDSSLFSIQWMLCEMTCNYRWLDNERIANLHMLEWSIFLRGDTSGSKLMGVSFLNSQEKWWE